MRRRLPVLVTLLLVVVAGCNAPLADDNVTTRDDGDETSALTTVPSTPEPRRDPTGVPTSSGTPTPMPADVAVSTDLPVDSGRTFARVRQLLNTSAEPPTVKVYEGRTTGGTFSSLQRDQFEAMLGIGPPQPVDDSDLQVGGMTLPTGRIYLVPRAGRASEIERTLAHEFTHAVQFDQGVRTSIRRRFPAERLETSDGTLAERSLLEGAAVYTASEYVRRYQPHYPTERTQIARLYRNATAGTKLYWAAYYHGAAYVQSVVDAPSQLQRVYRSPPTTTEQLLHKNGDVPDRLRVYAADGDSPWTVTERNSRGELFTRIVLGTEVSTPRAKRGASGWGNDQVLTFRGGPGPSFAWVTRWDDAANA